MFRRCTTTLFIKCWAIGSRGWCWPCWLSRLCGSLAEFSDQTGHSIFLLFDGLDKFELGSAAVKILAITMHLVIDIARQIVGEETNALLEGNQFAGEGKMLLL